MRRLTRPGLSDHALRVLKKRTKKVIAATDQKAEASRLWESKKNKTFDEIKERLADMASGAERCMYCEDSAGTDIEHFKPKATYPEDSYTWANYLLACSRCNSNYKRNEFPCDDNNAPLLIDPSIEDPRDHLTFSPHTGKFVASTQKGKESERVFGLKRGELVRGRKANWTAYEGLISLYAKAMDAGDDEEARRVVTSVENMPHSGVFIALVDAACDNEKSMLVNDECVTAVRRFDEIRTWLR